MYTISQFPPILYFLVLLGISGFCVAAEAPGLWLLGVGAIAINAWLIRTGRFQPMRRWLANIVSIGCLLAIMFQWQDDHDTRILVVGQGLVLLQIIKLYEQRANRDYGQIIVLSILLMVAAAISTASLIFGVSFIIYLFVDLYCCLLFHLKLETDHINKSSGGIKEAVTPASIAQQHKTLSRSMRRVTLLMSVFSIFWAAIVFLFCPRGSGESMLGDMQMRGPALTGFSGTVGFQKVAQISQSQEVIARMELYDHGERVTAPMPVLLRGSTLDYYEGAIGSGPSRWTWKRAGPPLDTPIFEFSSNVPQTIAGSGEGRYKQVISLDPTGTPVLFAMAGAVSLTASRDFRMLYFPGDGALRSLEALRSPIQYTVLSTGDLPNTQRPGDSTRRSAEKSTIDPEVARVARLPEVSGINDSGQSLADFSARGDHAFDRQIADHIQTYLRTNFSYTLDLTDLSTIGDTDPIVAFLTRFKAGHCEYFAGSMTLMCQALNIPARLVVGFSLSGDDFNPLGNYYIIKQSNAHAWCEVYVDGHWQSYDPTASAVGITLAGPGVTDRIKDFFDLLEFKWATSVVGYAGADRRNLVDNLDAQMTRTLVDNTQGMAVWPRRFSRFMDSLNDWWQSKVWTISSVIIGSLIVIVLAVMLGAVIWFVAERNILRRRARRIGLDSLKTSERLRLARQLAFYDDLLKILQRNKLEPMAHYTPLEFSHSLAHLPTEVYHDVHRVTEMFYRVRYGHQELSPQRQKWVATIISRIESAILTLLGN